MIGSEARGAWKELEGHLRPYLARRVASQADIDDLLQEIFVRMHRGLGQLRDGESFGGWVYQIARSVVGDRSRSQARRPVTALPGADVLEALPDEHDDLQAELGACVALFVSRLPSPYREAVTLTELQGLSQKDAAEVLGISLSGMKSRVQRARDKLRRMFDECCQISVDARGRVLECEPRDLAEVPADCRDAAVSWASRPR
jgi:RNA polymerase sigma-70 factor (ECF subfamily)